MAIDYAKWDEVFKISEEDVKAIKKNDGTYEDLNYDLYEVEITKMELASSKKGDPMLSVRFRILEGKNKGRLLFMNQMLTSDFGIHNCNEFLRSLESDQVITWTGSFEKYSETIEKVFNDVSNKYEYVLDYSCNSKGYPTYTINDIFDKA